MFRWLREEGGGRRFLGVAAIAYGLSCFAQGDFASPWQPVPQAIPFREALAYLSAGLLILGGIGLLVPRTVRPAAIILLILFGIYDAIYLGKMVWPRPDIAPLLGVAEQSSVVVGCWALLLRMRDGRPGQAVLARIVFGVCSILFGLAHFVSLKITASMVPAWMPPDQVFWAMATGVGHFAVGLALISNRIAVPATRIGALMYVCFAIFSWLLGALVHPTEWLRWAGAAISLCMAASLWLVGDLLATGIAGSAGGERVRE
jgi:uncharacterized membrane protein